MPDDRQVSYLTKEEVERFFKVIPGGKVRDRFLFDLIYRFGLRRREASLLQKNHLHEGRIWIERVKSGVSGEYPLHPATEGLRTAFFNIEDNGMGSPWLFASRQGLVPRPLSPSSIYAAFRRYAILAGLPESKRHVHILRHSIAVHLMNTGWEAADVQDWLGHRRITSTMVYARISNKRREENYAKTKDSAEIAKTNP